MPMKIKKTLFLKDLPRNISKNFSRDLKNEIEADIQSEILQGKSPVKGKKFKKYSPGYAKVKGWEKPVDMNKTGKMLKSLSVKQNKKGQLKISFSDEKAAWHDSGEGNLPVRRLLPRSGEFFNSTLTRLILRVLNLAVKKTIKKRN